VRLARPAKVTLPPCGSATIEGRVEMGEKVIINIRTFLDKQAAGSRAAQHAVTGLGSQLKRMR
jgi:lactate dehydrogenase-like 2-hydroxyacid dehydrogenase